MLKVFKKQYYQIKKVLSVGIYVYKFLYAINSVNTIVYTISIILISLNSYASIYLLSLIINQIAFIYNGQSTVEKSYIYVGYFVLFTIYQSALVYIRNITSYNLQLEYIAKYVYILYSKVNTLGISLIENPEINNKIERAKTQRSIVYDYFSNSIGLVSSLISIFTALFILYPSAPIVTTLLLLAIIPVIYFDNKFRSIGIKFDFDNTESRKIANANADHLLDLRKLPEIIINQSFKFLNTKYLEYANWYNPEALRIRKPLNRTHAIGRVLNSMVYATAMITLFKDVATHKISVGFATFIIRALADLASDLSSFFQSYNQVIEDTYRINDTYELLNMQTDTSDGKLKLSMLEKGPNILIKNLSFNYPSSEQLVIDNISLEIRSGEKVAIIGHNGAGKTTLIKLVAQMYNNYEGRIFVNNVNGKEIKKETLYRNLSVLFQDYNAYPNLTVKENIGIGRAEKDIDIEKVILAAQKADAAEFINKLPNKYDQILTPTVKDGTFLSTGQWQKLAIARFFYRNAPLVIFDEPTASIDALSEYKIFNQIYKFFKNKTVIIVSHRFSTVRNADRIIVIEQGKIIEQGSHDELMVKNGYYAKSFNIQAKGYS